MSLHQGHLDLAAMLGVHNPEKITFGTKVFKDKTKQNPSTNTTKDKVKQPESNEPKPNPEAAKPSETIDVSKAPDAKPEEVGCTLAQLKKMVDMLSLKPGYLDIDGQPDTMDASGCHGHPDPRLVAATDCKFYSSVETEGPLPLEWAMDMSLLLLEVGYCE